MKTEKIILLVSALLMITVIATVCLLTITLRFEGNTIENQETFQVEYEHLNKTLTHYMKFEAGEIISIEGVNLEGDLILSIDDMRGNNIYKKREMVREKLQLKVPRSGKYVLSVVGLKAKGSVTFDRVEFND